MKIAIIGPGALGSLFAALLSKYRPRENEVWLLDKDEKRAARLNRQGIAVEGVAGSFQAAVKVSADPAAVGKADLVVLCVKSYDTKSAIARAQGLIGDATSVLTVQNGIGNVEMIGEVVGPEKVIGGVTNLGVTLVETGRIRYCGKGDTIIGKIDGKTSVQMRAIRELFNGAGLDTKVSQDIKGFLWSKLVINAGINPLTALTRLSNGRLLEYSGTKKLLRETVTEAVKIVKRKRIKLLYDDPLAKVEAVCEATAQNMSSMLQDVLHAKRTEIEAINGVIVRFGQELGVSVPVNSTLVDLIKTIESSY